MKTRTSFASLLLASWILFLSPVGAAWGVEPSRSSHAMPASRASAADRDPAAQQTQGIEFVGHVGGAALSVAVQADYAYVGFGPSLAVIDISDPAHPAQVGVTPYLASLVRDIAVTPEGIAYAAADESGLLIIDVTDPLHPSVLADLDTPGNARGVAAAGDFVYVADSWGGLCVVNVLNPASPAKVGSRLTPGWAMDVAVAAEYHERV